MTERGHESGEEAELSTGFDVEASISDNRTRAHVDIPLIAGAAEEQCSGLTTFAMRRGDVGAVVECIDPRPMREQELVQSPVNALNVFGGVDSAFDPGLIRHANHEKPVVVGERERVPNSAEQLEPIRLSQIAKVGIEGTVPVDKECSPGRAGFCCRRSLAFHGQDESFDEIRVHPGWTFDLRMAVGANDLRILTDRLSAELDVALQPLRDSAEPIGVLFSGGVDSSLLAWEFRQRPHVALFTLGRESSPDVIAGRAAAERIGLPWHALSLDREGLLEAERTFGEELEGLPRVSRTVLLALAIAITEAESAHLVCGQGADELFLGYAHYRGLDAMAALRRSREDLDRLRATDWPRTQAIAGKVRKRISAPFLSPGFVQGAQLVPMGIRLPRDVPKRFFREWAMGRGLPPELALRPKKALQYGSGVVALARSLGKSGG